MLRKALATGRCKRHYWGCSSVARPSIPNADNVQLDYKLMLRACSGLGNKERADRDREGQGRGRREAGERV